jgi:2-dehydropantoate 2-reductase
VSSTAGLDWFTAQVKATGELSELEPHDIVVVALKSYHVPGIARQLQHVVDERTVLLPALNGIPWWYFHGMPVTPLHATIACLDPELQIHRHVDARRVLGCVVHIAASVPEPGLIRHTFGRRFILGEPTGVSSERLASTCDLFQNAGLDAQSSVRIRDDIWTKLVGNFSTNPLSALTHAWLDDLCASPALEAVSSQLIDEAMNVGTHFGIRFTKTAAEQLQANRTLGRSKPSMLQDVEKGRPLEIEAILGSVAELAGRVGIETPTLNIILALIVERARHLGLEAPHE